MNFKLPTIDRTKQSQQPQQYNFVNTNQRRRTKDVITPPVASLDDLKKKIEQQKREIETRNNAIMALQRNFESMAALLKTEKSENGVLKEEGERVRKMAEENGRRATEFHERNIQVGNELKRVKEENGRLGEEIKGLVRMNEQGEGHLKMVESLTKMNKKLQGQLQEMGVEKQGLMGELRRFKDVEKERREYQSLISELKQEIRVLGTEKDGLMMKIQQLQQGNRVLQVNLKNSQNQKQNLRRKNQDQKSREMESNGEITKLKNKIYSLEEELIKVRTEAENKNVIIMMKMKTEEELKGAMVDLKMKLGKNQGEILEKAGSIEEMKRRVGELEEKCQGLEDLLEGEKKRNSVLSGEVSKGSGKDQEMQSLLKELNQSRANVIDLQSKLKDTTDKFNRMRGMMVKYQGYFPELDSCSPAKILSEGQYNNMRDTILSLKSNIGSNVSEADDLNNKLRMQENELINLLKRLEKYESSERELSDLLMKEKSVLEQSESDRRIKEEEINKEKQKNKLLWSDNKKLKQNEQKLLEQIENQKQQLIIKSQKELLKLEQEKESQLREKERVMKEEYQKQFEILRSSNNDEVSKLLKKKGELIKELEEKLGKVTEQVEFYKNRYKQLEGVSARSERKLKEMEKVYNEGISMQKESYSQLQAKNKALQNDHKTCFQSIQSLTNRLSALQQFKKQNQFSAQQNKTLKDKLKSLQSQLLSLKKRLQPYQSQDITKKRQSLNNKIQLLLKSVSDLSQSLTSIKNHISCSHCCELPTETVKMIPCGHVFCKKCKEGYEDVCEECKKGGNVVQDKMHDQTVVKLNYMQMILVSVKEDTVILGKM